MIKISIEWIELDSEGEICKNCKKEIKGKKWVMILDFGDPTLIEPLVTWCTICKVNFDSSDSNSD